jgi:hypothetical protein
MTHEGEETTKKDGLEKKQGAPSSTALIEETGHLPADHVGAEINLESIGYFKAGYKRDYPKVPNESREVPIGEGLFRFIPSSYGYPNTDDLDLYRGLLKICEEQAQCERATDGEGRPYLTCKLPEFITFSTDKLLRYSGREDSAQNRRAVRNFIRRNKNTGIVGVMKTKLANGQLGEVEAQGDSWFRAYVIVGETKDGKKATENAVAFAAWFQTNYEHRYLKLVDLAFHQRLGTPIAKTLAPILDSGWYRTKGEAWQKNYRDLTTLLGIVEKRYLADIKRQLDPSHEELQRERYLESWEYDKAADGQGYVITWRPGEKWWKDQQEYARRRTLAGQLERAEKAKTKQREFRFPKSKPEAASTPAAVLTATEQDVFQQVRQAVSPYLTLVVFQRFLREGLSLDDMHHAVAATANAEKDGLIEAKGRLSFFMDYLSKCQAIRPAPGATSGGVPDKSLSSNPAVASIEIPSPSPSLAVVGAGESPAATPASSTPPPLRTAEPTPPQSGGGESPT